VTTDPAAAGDVPTPAPPGGLGTGPTWRTTPTHLAWLDAERRRLLAFADDPRHPRGGFGELDGRGHVRPDGDVHTWITARMTHVHALGHLLGVPGSAPLVDHGVTALRGLLHDDVHGGWFTAVGADGSPATTKDAYQHAFVLLAASSATAAGRPGARALLHDASQVVEDRFWDEASGRFVESFDRTWTTCEAYRGANSNMHGVEAALAVGDMTGDRRWHDRALRVATALIDEVARDHGWQVVEHFDEDWRPRLDHHRDRPDHPFRPYGTTVGHALEWSRLLLQLEATLDAAPDWLLPAARDLFATAVASGWAADGSPGFVYTLDPDGRPVVTNRMHWVAAEALAAAAALHRRTGDDVYEAWYRTVWDHVEAVFIDRRHGSWHHEVDPDGEVATGTWAGKPDLYHAVQATLLPVLAPAPSLATRLATPEPAGSRDR
jgi:sulfoquinovose isomerase